MYLAQGLKHNFALLKRLLGEHLALASVDEEDCSIVEPIPRGSYFFESHLNSFEKKCVIWKL